MLHCYCLFSHSTQRSLIIYYSTFFWVYTDKRKKKKKLKAHFHIPQFNSLKQFVNSATDFSVSPYIRKCIVLAMLQSSWTAPEQSVLINFL